MLLTHEVMREKLLHFYLSIFPLRHNRCAFVMHATMICNLSMPYEENSNFRSKQFFLLTESSAMVYVPSTSAILI